MNVGGDHMTTEAAAPIPRRAVDPATSRTVRIARIAVPALLVVLTAAAALWARLPLLDDSLWWDEIFSAHAYLDAGPWAITSPDLYIANNHVLYTLFSWYAQSWFGPGEFAVRFFGFVPAMGAAVLATAWAWRRLGAWVGVAVAVLFATSPLHVDVSTQGRGWGMAMLATVWMLVASVELGRLGAAAERGEEVRVGKVWTHLAGYGLAGVVGAFTILPMAIPFTMHALPLLRWRILRWRIIGTGLVIGAATVAFYAEVLEQIVRVTNRVGTVRGSSVGPLSWLTEGWNRLLRDHLAPFADSHAFAPSTPLWQSVAEVAVMATVVLLAGVALWSWWRSGGLSRLLAVHLVVGYVGTFLAMWLFNASVVDRYVSFLLGHVLLLVAAGAFVVGRAYVAWLSRPAPSEPTTRAGRRTARVAGTRQRLAVVSATGLMSLTALLPATALADHQSYAVSAPIEAASDAAAVVRAADPDVVITNRVNGFIVFRYYLGDDFEIIPPQNIGRRLCREVRFHPEHVIAFLDYPFPDGTWSGDLSCLVLRDTERTVLEQRRSPRGITVWISRPH